MIAIICVWEVAVVFTMVERPTEAITTPDDLLAPTDWWTYWLNAKGLNGSLHSSAIRASLSISTT